MKQKFAIYSTKLLDGICASAIIARFAKLRQAFYKLGDLSFPTVEQDFEELASLNDYYIFILDFPPDSIPLLEEKLKKVSESNRIVYWNSHHPYSKDAVEALKKYVQIIELSGPLGNEIPAQKLCSADMAAKRFLKHDYIAQTLREIAHDLEFWERKDPRSMKLADVIASGYDKKELIESLSLGAFWSEKFDRLREEYLEKKEKEASQLLKKLVIKQYADKKFGFTLASSILSTADAGQYVLDHSDVDVSVVVYKDGRMSFRRKPGCTVNLRDIAKLFNGGGHAYAAGGNLLIGKETPVRAVNLETFDTIVFYADRKLSDWFYK